MPARSRRTITRVIAEDTGVPVDEREAFHRGAGPGRRRQQPLQLLEPLAQASGALERFLRGGGLHRGDDTIDRLDGPPFQEGDGGVDPLLVVGLRYQPGAGSRALAQLMTVAGGLRLAGKQVALPGEDDRHPGLAVPESELVVQDANGLGHPGGRLERPVHPAVVRRIAVPWYTFGAGDSSTFTNTARRVRFIATLNGGRCFRIWRSSPRQAANSLCTYSQWISPAAKRIRAPLSSGYSARK
jgi:hypothetical protein